ncbi:MAG TPA: hypothetical protein PLU04_13270 [Anaerolineaceae bacterium]|mgnify:FL=1|nr:hypothetical protein [Anaerolineaceae bacterium]
MAAVWQFLEGGSRCPAELEAAHAVERYGAQPIYGRTLTMTEARRLAVAIDIETAYKARKQAENIAEWAKKHPESNDLLLRAMRCAHGE